MSVRACVCVRSVSAMSTSSAPFQQAFREKMTNGGIEKMYFSSSLAVSLDGRHVRTCYTSYVFFCLFVFAFLLDLLDLTHFKGKPLLSYCCRSTLLVLAGWLSVADGEQAVRSLVSSLNCCSHMMRGVVRQSPPTIPTG